MIFLKRTSYSNFKYIRKYCTATEKWPKQVFSGIQPTGNVHLGNYLGALQPWVKMQDEEKNTIYSIVDLHSITLAQDPKALKHNSLEIAATLLACGIDPDKSILFLQSSVPQHTELCWILGTLATMARLSHLPQYKEKTEGFTEIPFGLFAYPILQAADILLYKATHVPVGKDQIHQIQIAQQLASKFNSRFGRTFPRPLPIIDDQAASIKNLRDPSKKMSKSEKDFKSRINLNDPPDVILERCKKAVTDFTSQVTYDPENRPGVSNLVSIHSLLTNKSTEEVCKEVENLNTGQYKLVVAEVVIEHLKPIREKLEKYLSSPEYLCQILDHGAKKASEIAEVTLVQAKNAVGFVNVKENKIENLRKSASKVS